jgi:uncharacterized protein YjiS (DUF1127 family)
MAHVHGSHGLRSPAGGLATQAIAALASPLAWLERRRQRSELKGVLGLPDYLLKDIGLQRHEIVQEAFKPFWRP